MTRPCECGLAAVAPWSADQCRPCWLALNDARYQRLWGLPVTGPDRPRTGLPVIVRPVRCEHLGRRTERKAGCAGWKCRHDCAKGLPAVPAVYCQVCPEYAPAEFEDADQFPDRPRGPGWLDG